MIAKVIRQKAGSKTSARVAGSSFAYSARYVLAAIGGCDPLEWARGSDGALLSKSMNEEGIDERVGASRITNCISEDFAHAVLEVQQAQSMNQRVKAARHIHLVVSFPPGENPAENVLHEIEDRLMASIGLEDHQRLSVVHHDTSNKHFHIVASTIHPETFKQATLSHSIYKLQRESAAIEIDYSLERTNHGQANEKEHPVDVDEDKKTALVGWMRDNLVPQIRQLPDVDGVGWWDLRKLLEGHGVVIKAKGAGLVFVAELPGGVVEFKCSSVDRGFSKSKLEERFGAFDEAVSFPLADPARHPGEAVRSNEMHSGQMSLQSWIRDRACPLLDACLSSRGAAWSEVHEILSPLGLRLEKKGAGLVFVSAEVDGEKDLGVKASSVSRAYSKAKLEAILGEFVPVAIRDNSQVAEQYQRQPVLKHQEESGLWKAYQSKRSEGQQAGRAVYQAYLKSKKDLGMEFDSRAAGIKKSKTRGAKKKAEFARLAMNKKTEFEALRADYLRTIAGVKSGSWVGYLRDKAQAGNKEAVQTLRRQQARSVEHTARIRSSTKANFSEVTGSALRAGRPNRLGEIKHYAKDGGIVLERAGSVSIIKESEQSIAGMVAIASTRWVGRSVNLDGPEEFKEKCARLTGEKQAPISFSNDALEQVRYGASREVDEREENENERS